MTTIHASHEQDSFQRTLAARRELDTQMANLSFILNDPHDLPVPPFRITALLWQLARQLRLCFEIEESWDEEFDDPVLQDPRLHPERAAAHAEHGALVERLEECALDSLETSHDAPAADLDALAVRFTEFLRELQAHEDRETDLVLRAYGENLGMSD